MQFTIFFPFLYGPNQASFVYFRSFHNARTKYSTNLTINDKSIDGVLGSQTQGGRMEGADESTEQWRHCLSMLSRAKSMFFSKQVFSSYLSFNEST